MADETLKKRSENKDRSGHQFDEQYFRNLPIEEKIKAAEDLRISVEEFDAKKLWQFSQSKLGTLCAEYSIYKDRIRGVEKIMHYPMNSEEDTLYIESARDKTSQWTISVTDHFKHLVEELFKEISSNNVKSAAVETLFTQTLEQKLAAKRSGEFHIRMKPVEEKTFF